MKSIHLLSAFVLFISTFSFAHNLTLNQVTPSVSIYQGGEIFYIKNDIVYKDWNTSQLLNKVRVIQAIAGRTSAKEMNADLMTAITAEQFPESDYQTTSIINQDDSIWGSGTFVKSAAEKTKKEFEWSSIVLDENGELAKAWELQPENSAIIVQDKQGKIHYIKEGKLTSDEIKQIIALLHSLL